MPKSLSRIAIAAVAALGALATVPAHAGKTLDTIKQRGELVCGVNPGLAGFAAPDSQGRYSGLDIDYCKGLAAAILGDVGLRVVPGPVAGRRTVGHLILTRTVRLPSRSPACSPATCTART